MHIGNLEIALHNILSLSPFSICVWPSSTGCALNSTHWHQYTLPAHLVGARPWARH